MQGGTHRKRTIFTSALCIAGDRLPHNSGQSSADGAPAMAQRSATIYAARVRARRLPCPTRMRRRDWVCREQFRRHQVTKTRPEFEPENIAPIGNRRENAGPISIFQPPVQILQPSHDVGAVASSPDERRSRDIRDPEFRSAHAGYGSAIGGSIR